jgi:hypothetical protein
LALLKHIERCSISLSEAKLHQLQIFLADLDLLFQQGQLSALFQYIEIGFCYLSDQGESEGVNVQSCRQCVQKGSVLKVFNPSP